MTGSELRKKFLQFFERRGHRVIPSDSLIPPPEDKSLLFTGAGMNQFKNEFMGRGRPGLKRAVTCQKCLRTGDMEKVGHTPAHHTFFEMLGNFSFGDYFKREAMLWAWEFMTLELGIAPERLRVSVYEEDDEAYAIWEKEVGVRPEAIYRYGQHENFWPADAPRLGPNGLCGPCAEIFYDWGPEVGCGRETCEPACDCGRFCEVWNLVFQQYNRLDGGVLEPLPLKNIDTGMGLERAAAVMQGKFSDFECDLFLPIIRAIEGEVEKDYAPRSEAREGVAFRRIADHIRAAAFCIADGVLPGNAGRGYVLRKLIRRAVLDGNRLERREPFLYRLVPAVARIMADAYPELVERRENIARLIRIEEERFHQTLDVGLRMLEERIERLRQTGREVLPGEEAFRLFDTYGLPLDVTESILADEGLRVEAEGFEREMERQRQLSRSGTRISADIFGSGPVARLKERGCATRFEGYERDETQGTVLGIVCADDLREEAAEGDACTIVLDRTTFYAEAGGEVGDTGLLEGEGGRFQVEDTQRSDDLILHVGRVARGRIRQGDLLTARPDVERRAAIRRNHTATHLLHFALREVLGPHAEQAGSLVAPDRLRFDFTHTEAMTDEELRLVEDRVNQLILQNSPVTWRILPLEQARAEGAVALFGEKYGEEVRLLDIGGYSKELCAGLHCSATGEIGLFKILGESSVAAGIRRIEAVTGMEALRRFQSLEEAQRKVCAELGVPADADRALERIRQQAELVRDLRRQLHKARQAAGPGAAEYMKQAREVGGTKIATVRLPEASAEDLRALADRLRRMAPSVAAVLGSADQGRALLVVALTRDLVERGLHAGRIAGQAAKVVGGGGGGRPDMAQAGGRNPDALEQALRKAADDIAQALSISAA